MNRRELLRGSALIGLAAHANPKAGTWPTYPCVRLLVECAPAVPYAGETLPTMEKAILFHESRGRRVIHTSIHANDLGAVVVEIVCSRAKVATELALEIVRVAGTKAGIADYGLVCEVASYVGE